MYIYIYTYVRIYLFRGEAESARKRTTPAQTKARLRALSQELTEADMRLFGDEWDDGARGVRTDGRQFQ